MRPIEFNMATIPYTELCSLCGWTTSRITQHPAFCAWFADVLGSEGVRRQDEPETLPSGYITIPNWDNQQLADALEAITALSFAQGLDQETTGKFLDKLTIHIASLAARRLRERYAVKNN